MYKRTLSEIIIKSFKEGFVTIIYGARMVGKTVLLGQIRKIIGDSDILSFNGDTSESVDALNTNSEVKLTKLVENHGTIFIDEAQKIPGISLALKIIIDKFPNKHIIVTGSSSLQLARGSHESLTGRNQSFTLFPLSTTELSSGFQSFQIPALLETQLVFGGYPHVYALPTIEEKKKYLADIVKDYLFQDVLSLEKLDRPENLKRLATLLAFQIGKEASLNELANTLDVSVKTVSRYIDLLEKSFIIFHIDAHSSNMRKEIAKSKKYYFYDLGIRNALIEQFHPPSARPDTGELWENFLIIERVKKHEDSGTQVTMRFWRTYEMAEIDLVEIKDGKLEAFEFKWNKEISRTPKAFKDTYSIEAKTINRNNYLEFIF